MSREVALSQGMTALVDDDGYFDTAEQAARAYDAHALTTWGDYARLNFPRQETAA